jgi:hypothetical protein
MSAGRRGRALFEGGGSCVLACSRDGCREEPESRHELSTAGSGSPRVCYRLGLRSIEGFEERAVVLTDYSEI